ncbi:hypothetical protein L6R52_11285 [Myxococcota bacterium]|nr:hypothetical protein [Myxococcota bacterium]
MARRRLGAILVEAGVLEEYRLREALRAQRRAWKPLGRILVEAGHISEPLLVQALSVQLRVPIVDLDQLSVAPEALAKIPLDVARRSELIPFALNGRKLSVAMADPTNQDLVNDLQSSLGLVVVPHIAGPAMIDRAIERHYD